MKFSVLLPTRNRLEYLKYAISSVLYQDYENWEIIVSDNDSEEDIKGYVTSLNDSRVKYFKTKSFCPVTENWNNAMEKSTGDYVVMLGDDDCLLKGYFSHCLSLLNLHQFPDMIYNSAFIYIYPAVLQKIPNGKLEQHGNASFLVGQIAPYILDRRKANKLVNEILNFSVAVNFNMQHSLVSRKLILEMQRYGKFYQSPYPDYYATTALLLKAERVLAVPYPMVVIGVTPKSFGYFYLNNKENDGIAFLQNVPNDEIYQSIVKHIIPGTNMNICWLFANETIRKNFGKEFDLKVNYKKFRLLQVLHQYKKYMCNQGVNFKDLISYWKNLSLWEKFAYFIPYLITLAMRRIPSTLKERVANRMVYAFSHPKHGVPKQILGNYKNILEVFHQNNIENHIPKQL
jgi:glycosyltransferase involved in cell wall biosynthesis